MKLRNILVICLVFCFSALVYADECVVGGINFPVTLCVDDTVISTTEEVFANWHSSTPSSLDWVAIVPRGEDWSNGDEWVYTGGNATGNFSFNAPSIPGLYDVVYYYNNGMSDLVRVPITVGLINAYVNNSALIINWSYLGNRHAKDWVTVVEQGYSWYDEDWAYTNGAVNGSVILDLPNQTGIYDVRYYHNNGFDIVFESVLNYN